MSSASDLRERAALAKVAIEATPRNLAAGVGAALLIVVGMSFTSDLASLDPDREALAWFAAITFGMISGILLAIRHRSKVRTDAETVATSRHLVVNALYCGVVWGAAAWVFLPARSPGQDAFLIILLSMVLCGGVGAQAPQRSLVYAFGLTTAAIFLAGLFRLGDALHVLLGVCYALLCAAAMWGAREQERSVTLAHVLSVRNEELLLQRTRQQVLAERARQQAEDARVRAETADRSKTTFMAAASHDLRQPMHALVQYVAHLRRVCEDARLMTTIQKIEDSVSAMEDLLNAVLDFSKIAMGVVEPQISGVYINQVLERVETQMRPLAETAGLQFIVSSDAGWVSTDEVMLERVLRNVVQNALRYTPAGTVTLRARRRKNCMRLLVADTGIGIPRVEKERIFDEYYQLNNAARDRRKGLGLGLAIVRSLAQLLDVKIRVKSLLGSGSVFALELPLCVESAVPEPKEQAVSEGEDYVRGALVLLIDDDPFAREGLAVTLHDFGCRVLAVSSASDALRALETADFAPQIVVSDYRLEGGLTGIDAIRTVQQNQRLLCGDAFPLRAILVSGDTSPQELERVRAAGYPMLHKPVAVARLRAALNAELTPLAQA